MKVAYLLKKFPRLSETFVLGELLRQEALGAELHVFSRRGPDDEPRHPELRRLRAEVEVLPTSSGLDPWRELFREGADGAAMLERLGPVMRPLLESDHPRLSRLVAESLYVLRRCHELGIDHLHVHFATDSALVAQLVHGLGGPGYSLTAHAKDIYRSTVRPAVLSRMIAESRFTVTVCDANVRHLEETLDAQALARVRRLYNGLELDDFPFVSVGREDAHVVAIGRLVEKKGFDLLIRAAGLLRDAGVHARVSILGDGDQREALDALIDELDLRALVTLEGAVDQDAVRRALATGTVFCLPCRVGEDGNRDALPTVLLEALATGIPSISTPVTGVPEILDGGRCGRLVPENDPRAVADALGSLLGDPAARAALAAAGRAHAEATFDGHQIARTLRGWMLGEVPEGAAR